MYHIVFRYKSFTHALICACAWKKKKKKNRKVTTLLSLSLHFYSTQIHKKPQREKKKTTSCYPYSQTVPWPSDHSHQITSVTVHLTLVHITGFYWTDSKGHSQKCRGEIQNMGFGRLSRLWEKSECTWISRIKMLAPKNKNTWWTWTILNKKNQYELLFYPPQQSGNMKHLCGLQMLRSVSVLFLGNDMFVQMHQEWLQTETWLLSPKSCQMLWWLKNGKKKKTELGQKCQNDL